MNIQHKSTTPQLKHSSIIKNQSPCKNCLTYAICKNIIKEYISTTHAKFSTITVYRVYEYVLKGRCSLIEDYFESQYKIQGNNITYRKPMSSKDNALVFTKNLVLKSFDMTENDLADLVHAAVCKRMSDEESMY